MTDYYYPNGRDGEGFKVVYEFTGFDMVRWYVDRERGSKLYLKIADDVYRLGMRRHLELSKKAIDSDTFWPSQVMFSYDIEKALEAGRADIRKRRAYVDKIEQKIEDFGKRILEENAKC